MKTHPGGSRSFSAHSLQDGFYGCSHIGYDNENQRGVWASPPAKGFTPVTRFNPADYSYLIAHPKQMLG
jgi:hypothetical protein